MTLTISGRVIFHFLFTCYVFIESEKMLYVLGWLGGLVVRALDSRLNGCEFDSQPRHCQMTTLGKLFAPLSPSSITRYWRNGGDAVRLGR